MRNMERQRAPISELYYHPALESLGSGVRDLAIRHLCASVRFAPIQAYPQTSQPIPSPTRPTHQPFSFSFSLLIHLHIPLPLPLHLALSFSYSDAII